MRTSIIITLICSFFLHSCWDLQTGKPVEGVASGVWRGTFLLGDQVVPIAYEVLNTDNDKPIEIIFKTAKQELKADEVRVWGDTLFIEFYKTNSVLKVVYQIDKMDGLLYDKTGDAYPIVFAGQYAMMHRFVDIRKTPTANLTGEWLVSATGEQDSLINGNVRLAANNNYLEGTLNLNGNSILLEGTVQGDKFYLSGFDGKTVALFSATIGESKKLNQGNLKINQQSFFWEGKPMAGVVGE